MSEVDIGLPTNFNVGEVVGSASNALVNVLVWLLAILIVGALIFAVFYFLSFKYKVRVKKCIRGRTVVIDDKARIHTDKNGGVWWVFLKTKIKTNQPPSEALDITRKGKFIAEGYLLEDGRFIWRIDDFDTEKFKSDEQTKNDTNFTGGYHYFTSKERSLLANEVVEAQQYRKKKLLDMLVAIAPYLAIIMIFVLFLVFFDNVVSPAVELGASIEASHKLQLETMQIIQNIVQNKETMMLNATNIPN